VKEAFAAMELNDEQFEQIYDYLKKHKVSFGEPVDAEEYLTEEEKDYLHALRGWFALKTPIEEGFRAAEKCRQAGKKIYLLSNYPQEGFEFVTKEYAKRFEIFDGGVISCYVHQLKPEKEIYETIMARYDIDPARALFIDDTLVNVEGAIKMGIHGFHMHESGMMDRFFL
jgi:putative hydrolase of the HAD superfamily